MSVSERGRGKPGLAAFCRSPRFQRRGRRADGRWVAIVFAALGFPLGLLVGLLVWG